MNDMNAYKFAQIGGALLTLAMIFLLTVVGWYETTTMITWVALMFVGVGVFYGARKLDEAERDRKLDDLKRDRNLEEPSREE
jgi:hypothetical protein